jgi:hypothetical protein
MSTWWCWSKGLLGNEYRGIQKDANTDKTYMVGEKETNAIVIGVSDSASEKKSG